MAKEKKSFTIGYDKAVGLLGALGSKNAEKLDEARLLGKLQSIDETDDDADPGKFSKTYEKLVAANKKGYDIEIEDFPAKSKAKASNGKAEKPAKAAKGKAAKASAKEKKPRAAAAASDAYGAREGSGSNRMNMALEKAGKKGLPLDKLMKIAKVPRPYAAAHMQTLKKKGFGKQNKEGNYVITG